MKPYEKYKKTKRWLKIKKAISQLQKNKDIVITTLPDYVIGYLCQSLSSQKETITIRSSSRAKSRAT